LFAEKINDTTVKDFVKICNEVIEGLSLPMVFFATKISDEKFRLYSPWDLEDYKDIGYIAHSIRYSFKERYNPILTKSEVMHRRKAIKTALKIP
jgi:hypothetical protein